MESLHAGAVVTTLNPVISIVSKQLIIESAFTIAAVKLVMTIASLQSRRHCFVRASEDVVASITLEGLLIIAFSFISIGSPAHFVITIATIKSDSFRGLGSNEGVVSVLSIDFGLEPVVAWLEVVVAISSID